MKQTSKSMDPRELQRRNRELSILNEIAQRLNREVELEKALHASLRQTVELLDLHTGWIWLLHPETGKAYLAAGHQLPPAFTKHPERLEGWCYCIEHYLTGGLEDATNISEITCTRLKDLQEGTKGLRYHASVPLFSRERKIGIMNVVSENSQELSGDKLRLLYTIGDMLSIAVARARLYEDSRRTGMIAERNRLAREIHDTLAQGLSAIALKLDTIDALLESGNAEKARKIIRQTQQLAKHSLEEARRSVLDLRASPLKENPLPVALERLIRETCHDQQLECSFTLTGDPRPLPLRTAMGLYRIAQEALQNVVKHAKAGRVHLALQYQPDSVILIVEDDGQGFDPANIPDQGFGLTGLSERARLLNGTLHLESAPGKGTRMIVEVGRRNSVRLRQGYGE
jgi:two-component system NarL family sensor kinase